MTSYASNNKFISYSKIVDLPFSISGLTGSCYSYIFDERGNIYEEGNLIRSGTDYCHILSLISYRYKDCDNTLNVWITVLYADEKLLFLHFKDKKLFSERTICESGIIGMCNNMFHFKRKICFLVVDKNNKISRYSENPQEDFSTISCKILPFGAKIIRVPSSLTNSIKNPRFSVIDLEGKLWLNDRKTFIKYDVFPFPIMALENNSNCIVLLRNGDVHMSLWKSNLPINFDKLSFQSKSIDIAANGGSIYALDNDGNIMIYSRNKYLT